MAISVARGQLTQPGSTGNQSVTGLSFQPKVVLFFSTAKTAAGSSANAYLMQGAAISSSNRMCCLNGGGDASNSTGAGNWITRCVVFISDAFGAATVLAEADFVSLNSDGFTINWATVDATARVIEWVAVGGADVANVAVLQHNTATATGNQSITGMAFQPNLGIRMGGRGSNTTGSATASTTLTGGPLRMAAVKSSTERWISFQDVRSSGDTGVLDTSHIETIYISNALTERADFVSWNSDGLTINFDTASATSKFAFWVLFDLSCPFSVGTFAQKTSTGTLAETGPGHTPDMLMFASNGIAANNTPAGDQARPLRSIILGTGDYVSLGAHSNNNAPDIRATRYSTTKAVELWRATATGGTITVDADADVTSLDTNGFTLDWTTADATAREIGYLSIGHTTGGGFNPAWAAGANALIGAGGVA